MTKYNKGLERDRRWDGEGEERMDGRGTFKSGGSEVMADRLRSDLRTNQS